MVDFKVVISDTNNGKTYQKEVKDEDAKKFIGLRIGDKLKADFPDIGNVEVEVTGGSDKSGFPMRKDVMGTGRKKILAVGGVGIKRKEKGIKQRKTVCGNTIHAQISQINLKVLGGKPVKLEGKKTGEKPAEKEKPVEAKTEKKPEEKKQKDTETKQKKSEQPKEDVPKAEELAKKKQEEKK
jgi:small subunit ribosomal protein S6e